MKEYSKVVVDSSGEKRVISTKTKAFVYFCRCMKCASQGHHLTEPWEVCPVCGESMTDE